MRRAVARGRVYPQSYSTDRRIGRLSLAALSLYPLMWSNADDQGRLVGDPEEIKYSCCPNIDHISKMDIPNILEELEENKLILRYQTVKSDVIQMLDWWAVNYKLQWAWPSDYPPHEGWTDHLRYKEGAKNVVTANWPVSAENSGENSGESRLVSQVRTNNGSGENSGEGSGEGSPESHKSSPLSPPFLNENENENEKEGGKRNSPEHSGEDFPPPSLPITSPIKLLNEIKNSFRMQWGRVPAGNPEKIIPRRPDAKENAQMRDLANELSKSGGCPPEVIKRAFREAASYQKFNMDYVRKVLLSWLGVPAERG